MIGAVIFVIFFLIFFAATLGMPMTLPPGSMIHDILNIPMTSYPVLGFPAWQLINASTNGVVWGFVVWLIFSIFSLATGRGKKEQVVQQTVSVQVEDKPKEKEPKSASARNYGWFEMYKDAAGKFRFRLKAANGETIAVSESYESKASCKNGMESVKNSAPIATVKDLTA